MRLRALKASRNWDFCYTEPPLTPTPQKLYCQKLLINQTECIPQQCSPLIATEYKKNFPLKNWAKNKSLLEKIIEL